MSGFLYYIQQNLFGQAYEKINNCKWQKIALKEHGQFSHIIVNYIDVLSGIANGKFNLREKHVFMIQRSL